MSNLDWIIQPIQSQLANHDQKIKQLEYEFRGLEHTLDTRIEMAVDKAVEKKLQKGQMQKILNKLGDDEDGH